MSVVVRVYVTTELPHTLVVLQVLAEVMGPESVVKLMLPVVIGLAADSVANVRFNVAKTLQKIAPVLDAK